MITKFKKLFLIYTVKINYAHKQFFYPKDFRVFKNGQKKCPKMKNPKYFWEK